MIFDGDAHSRIQSQLYAWTLALYNNCDHMATEAAAVFIDGDLADHANCDHMAISGYDRAR